MADSLHTTLAQLKEKIIELKERNAHLEARALELEISNEDLKQKAQAAEEARRRSELDIEYLKVSHRLADSPDTLIETRRHIAQLIRNIDRCLDMLKE